MWLIINWIFFAIGCGAMGWAKYIDSSENTGALLLFFLGVVIIICVIMSALALKFWG